MEGYELMKKWIAPACIVMFGILSLGTMSFAADPARIAIADPAKVFTDIRELKDLRAKIDSDRLLLEGMDREKRENLNSLKAARDALKPGTQQYKEKNVELNKVAIEYDSWSKINQADFAREQKLQMKSLYQKIEAAIAEVAKTKGFDLVLADHRPEFPEDLDQINMDNLRALINSRTVMFANEKVDITNDVVIYLDQKYRAAGAGSPVAPSAPAAAPTTKP